MTCPTGSELRGAIVEKGYAIVPGALGPDMLAKVGALAKAMIEGAPADHREANRTTGSMLGIDGDAGFADLIAWAPTLAAIRSMDFGRLAFSAGYVISKPPGGPRLFWHQDWLWWTHPVSRSEVPHQLFAMYYLVDTDRANGCLRVVPGSHRKHMPAHDRLARAHSPEALAGADASHPMFGDLDGEIDVPVRAGDLLLGDSRLLHAAHANADASERTLLTLWYHPAFDSLPGEVQGYLADHYGEKLCEWPAARRNRIDCQLPYRTGSHPAWPLCREPHSPLLSAR